MYKCIKAFMSTSMEKWYYGMRMKPEFYEKLTPKEQANFIVEVEPVKPDDEETNQFPLYGRDLDAPNEFQEGGGARGEY